MEARIPFLGGRVRKEDERRVEGVEAEVFDETTLLTLYKLMTDGIIDKLEFPISTGKEAVVFRGTSRSGFVAVKIYCVSNRTFKNISKYILGDPRFMGISSNPREVIYAWARKEFKNLEALTAAGVRVPKPIRSVKNVMVFEYIGSETSPACQLKDARMNLEQWKETYDFIVRNITKAVKDAHIVHGDLSEYNILVKDDGSPVIIDVGQGVVCDHPNAKDWFIRDVKNIVQFFKKRDVAEEEDFEKITKSLEKYFEEDSAGRQRLK
ncbi:MAG: serine protein kinase RIO [Candidatus Thermoplasmatota archaeon]|nr:serine protein kinase RIO [Candidatus Thermoplasmatota archaeon]